MEPNFEPQVSPVIPPPPPRTRRFTIRVVLALVLVGLLCGGFVGYAVTYMDFNTKLNQLQSQIGYYQNSTGDSLNNYFLSDNANVSLANLYAQVKNSVVVITDIVPQYGFFGSLMYSVQQGSGFVVNVNDQLVVVTNNHVIDSAINVTVTFANGDSLPATVLGADSKADLAILSVSSIPNYAVALTLVSSTTLQVGDPVVAVGSPYGLSGTLTTGVISALGRTITVSDSGTSSQTIPDMIQTSTAINSGNSGGPLINYAGEAVGITTAAVSNSEGLGFAVPSSTIIREINLLITTGSYDQHPSINAEGTDMNYQIAQAMNAPVTYGWLVERVSTQNGLEGGNTQKSIMGSQVIIGGDIITAINDHRITNGDDLLSYLERNALPGQTMNFTVIRGGEAQTIQVTIGNA
jgi:S1-C subfamily serine protease